MAPYHATAADRISLTEAGLGRKVWAERDLPDTLSKALWWKQRRWYFADLADGLRGGENDNPYNIAIDERDEAADRHRTIIELMWATRFADRQQARMLRLANGLTAATEAAVASYRRAALSPVEQQP